MLFFFTFIFLAGKKWANGVRHEGHRWLKGSARDGSGSPFQHCPQPRTIIFALLFSSLLLLCTYVQGDHSACSKPPVDVDLKKRNFQINVNERF